MLYTASLAAVRSGVAKIKQARDNQLTQPRHLDEPVMQKAISHAFDVSDYCLSLHN